MIPLETPSIMQPMHCGGFFVVPNLIEKSSVHKWKIHILGLACEPREAPASKVDGILKFRIHIECFEEGRD